MSPLHPQTCCMGTFLASGAARSCFRGRGAGARGARGRRRPSRPRPPRPLPSRTTRIRTCASSPPAVHQYPWSSATHCWSAGCVFPPAVAPSAGREGRGAAVSRRSRNPQTMNQAAPPGPGRGPVEPTQRVIQQSYDCETGSSPWTCEHQTAEGGRWHLRPLKGKPGQERDVLA